MSARSYPVRIGPLLHVPHSAQQHHGRQSNQHHPGRLLCQPHIEPTGAVCVEEEDRKSGVSSRQPSQPPPQRPHEPSAPCTLSHECAWPLRDAQSRNDGIDDGLIHTCDHQRTDSDHYQRNSGTGKRKRWPSQAQQQGADATRSLLCFLREACRGLCGVTPEPCAPGAARRQALIPIPTRA